MDGLDKEIEKLDIKISEIQHSVGCVKELLANSKMVEKSIDISKIAKVARANVLTNHRIGQLDDDLGYKYCCALASFSMLVDNTKQKVTQLLFVLRIYYAKGQNLSTDAFVRDMNLFSINDWDSLIQELDDEIIENLFVDLLMEIYLCPDVNEEQMEFLCQLAALGGKNETDFALYAKIAKAILQQKKEDLFDLVNDSKNVNRYSGYFREPFDYCIVGKLEDISKVKNDKICLWKDEIKDRLEILDIDTYQKSEIVFGNCTFDNVLGIYGSHTRSIFDKCLFSNSEQKNINISTDLYGHKRIMYGNSEEKRYFINIQNAVFTKCRIRNCSVEGYLNESAVLQLTNSVMDGCIFENCKVGIRDTIYTQGALVNLKKTTLKNCEFYGCSSYGEDASNRDYPDYYMRILEARDSRVMDNTFKECQCNTQNAYKKNLNNYIVVYNSNCIVENNIYQSCACSQCKYNDNYKFDKECLIE